MFLYSETGTFSTGFGLVQVYYRILQTSKHLWMYSIFLLPLVKAFVFTKYNLSFSCHYTETVADPLGNFCKTTSLWLLDGFWVCLQTLASPFPSATNGFPFLVHVTVAAGFASAATQVPTLTRQNETKILTNKDVWRQHSLNQTNKEWIHRTVSFNYFLLKVINISANFFCKQLHCKPQSDNYLTEEWMGFCVQRRAVCLTHCSILRTEGQQR